MISRSPKAHKRAAQRKAARDYEQAARRKNRPVINSLRRAFKLAIMFALAVHIYALLLRFIPVPYTLNMLRDDNVTRDWVSIEDVAPDVIYAIIGAEDSRFCSHNGIDWDATLDALDSNQNGGRRRGASGLTQQTAKNVFFWNGGGYARKAFEAYAAYFIDFTWGKRRVMEIYLNVAEWGDGIYGIEKAAQSRFGKPATDLTPHEAALLASVLPSPNKWRVDPPGPYVTERAATLQARAETVRNKGTAKCVLNSPKKR